MMGSGYGERIRGTEVIRECGGGVGSGVEDPGLSSDSDISKLVELCNPGHSPEQDEEYWVCVRRARCVTRCT